MGNANFDYFINKIAYSETDSQNEKSELRHWLEMIGTYKYERYYNTLKMDRSDITFEDLKNCATYDFNLSRIIFAMLKHCENYLRATVTHDIDDFELIESDNFNHKIQKIIGAEGVKMKKSKWPMHLNKTSSFYKFIDASVLSTIIKCYLVLPLERIIFDQEDLNHNLMLINAFRNSVYHHYCLIDNNSKENYLKSNIINLFRYLPSPNTRTKYIDFIMKESNRVGNKYRYPILFTQEERDEIMSYRGCNYEYKD